jgi:hypothetical protein
MEKKSKKNRGTIKSLADKFFKIVVFGSAGIFFLMKNVAIQTGRLNRHSLSRKLKTEFADCPIFCGT